MSVALAPVLCFVAGSAPARAWEHAVAWTGMPECGGMALQTDPLDALRSDAEFRDGWPLPMASVTAEPSLTGIGVPVLPGEIHMPPVDETWDQVAERVHAASHAPWSRGASAAGSWLFVVLSGTAGVAASFAVAIGVFQKRSAR